MRRLFYEHRTESCWHTEFYGFDIPVIEGGFGKNQKVILAKTVADIHGVRLLDINALISNNIEEFEIGVDILDLKNSNDTIVSLSELGFSKQSVSNSKNIYILSEQGYMLLVGFMKTEKAKEIRKQLRREYFAMREIINSNEQLKAKLLLSIYDGGQEAVVSARKLTDLEVSAATKPLLDKIETSKPLVEFADHVSNTSDLIDIGTLAKIAKDEHIDIGRTRLFEWLRSNGYLIGSGSNKNQPYQRYIEQGLFKVKEYTFSTPYGSKVGTKTYVTGKGQIYFVEKLRGLFPSVA